MTPFEFVFFAFQILFAAAILYALYLPISWIARGFAKTTRKNHRVYRG